MPEGDAAMTARISDPTPSAAGSLHRFLFDIEPLAHEARCYAEATRLLAENTGVSPNTLIKVAYLAQDSTEKLLAAVLAAFELQRS